MQSTILITKLPEEKKLYIAKIKREYEINEFDVFSHFQEETKEGKRALGIADVRSIQKTILLTPQKSSIKLVVIDLESSITKEAQNALLKMLEEPPPHSIIVLIAPTLGMFIPTIISRCTIIETKQSVTMPADDFQRFEELLLQLNNGSLGQKLKTAYDMTKNKDKMLSELEGIMQAGRTKLTEAVGNGNEPSIAHLKQTLNALVKLCYITLTTNANPRLAAEGLFIDLS